MKGYTPASAFIAKPLVFFSLCKQYRSKQQGEEPHLVHIIRGLLKRRPTRPPVKWRRKIGVITSQSSSAPAGATETPKTDVGGQPPDSYVSKGLTQANDPNSTPPPTPLAQPGVSGRRMRHLGVDGGKGVARQVEIEKAYEVFGTTAFWTDYTNVEMMQYKVQQFSWFRICGGCPILQYTKTCDQLFDVFRKN
ncbi:hypothetical protein Pmani_001041 [Petrolisthes manimaculis]|uniref:Uncharacterized protein n=1 Tax=Petrolisthes manimaculis TaxID=1843537 RepID=A0AAE1US09_9EUCA|nr:hypothetical protein Pmani_001041 [Petrolisthes manimaculis]